MKKMRLESLEHLLAYRDPIEVARMGFQLADQSVRDLRKIGIETDFIQTLILADREFDREEVFKKGERIS